MRTGTTAGVALTMLALSSAASTAQEFPVSGLFDGVVADEAACRATVNALWIEVDGRGDCIRFYPSTGNPGKTALFYISGDRLLATGNSEEPSGYVDNSVAAQTEQVRWIAAGLNIPVIKIARPGTYGSSGKHTDRRLVREQRLVNEAVRMLQEHFGIENAAVVGQSGGGNIAAYILTQQPALKCVVLTSSGLSILAEGAAAYNNRPGVYDPVSHVQEIQPNPQRRVFVVGDERDRVSPISNQRRYFETLRTFGHDVTFLKGSANPPVFHTLDRTGFHVATWCLEGVSTEEIMRMVASGALRG